MLATSGQYQTVPVAFTVDVGQLRRHRQLRKRLSQQVIAHQPHPAPPQGLFVERQIFPDALLIQAARGHRQVDVGMPVEPPAIGVQRTENPDAQTAPLGGVDQVIGRQPKQRIEQPAVVEEQGPQRVGQREHQMLPGAVGQTVVLHGDPLVGGLFAAGRTGPAMAGVAQVFDVRALLIGAGVVFDAQDRGAAGEHFADRLHFDLAQTAGLQQICPAAVGREEVFERSRCVSRRCRGHVSRAAPHRGE
ncbi:hypothetical protein ALQ08_200069 [Pseudomonas syringae pv. delphinii]|uniref:Uncharacterized protein n=1 Tax=Pseudomonas syringae pv. delphinii TaxID=192088 RepID=A0A3M4KFH0_9PSED|nr:hypothetical protein ALQ08_200069 [Pseudomonas syringae pv. delphinii]